MKNHFKFTLWRWLHQNQYFSLSKRMNLSSHVVFKSHAVFLFYILKGEFWVFYGATHIQDYDYEKKMVKYHFKVTLWRWLHQNLYFSLSKRMYLSTHVVFKSHAVFLFYLLKREFWVWYGATHIEDYDHEKKSVKIYFKVTLWRSLHQNLYFFLSKRMK